VREELTTMGEGAHRMLRGALEAFATGDVARAHAVITENDTVDEIYGRTVRIMIELITANTLEAAGAVGVIQVSRSLERVADHAINIAEKVTFIVRGDDVCRSSRPILCRSSRMLRFTPDVLARIFLGEIKTWNDANADLKLPATPIVVVHRSDGSGTKVSADYQGTRFLDRHSLDLPLISTPSPYWPAPFAMSETWAMIRASFSGFFCWRATRRRALSKHAA
jgi:hypothetical protein